MTRLTHHEGEEMTFTAVGDSRNTVDGWVAKGVELTDAQAKQATLTLTMPAGAVKLAARFKSKTRRAGILIGTGVGIAAVAGGLIALSKTGALAKLLGKMRGTKRPPRKHQQ